MRRVTPTALLASVLAATASLTIAAAADDTKCDSGLHMIVARGTSEDAGPGVTGELADGVAKRIPGSDVVGLDYPASLTSPFYPVSVSDGVTELHTQIRDYIKKCPDSKLAVMGYSQGAQVVSDVFCGGTAAGQSNKALPESLVSDSVVAIVLFGDPTHVGDASYNKGTSKHDGIFPRSDVRACEALGSRIVSYCDDGDVYCDNGNSPSLLVHTGYVGKYGDEVVKFVVDQYKNPGKVSSIAPQPTTTSSATSTQTSAATSTGASDASTTSDSAPTNAADADGAASELMPGMGLIGLTFMAMGMI